MGWNGSGIKITSSELPKRSEQKGHQYKFKTLLIAFAICAGLAVGIGLILSLVRDEGDEITEKPQRAKLIATNAPVRVVKATPKTKAQEMLEELRARLRPTSTNNYRDANGVLRRPGGMRVIEGPVTHGKLPDNFKKPPFSTGVENEILSILLIQPGQRRFAERTWTPKFEADFKASLKLGDQIKPEDSDVVKEQKRAVWEAKQDILQQMKEGRTLKEIIKESQAESKRFASYRENLLKDVSKVMEDPKMNESDINDCIDAANKILEENGLKKLNKTLTLNRWKLMKKKVQK